MIIFILVFNCKLFNYITVNWTIKVRVPRVHICSIIPRDINSSFLWFLSYEELQLLHFIVLNIILEYALHNGSIIWLLNGEKVLMTLTPWSNIKKILCIYTVLFRYGMLAHAEYFFYIFSFHMIKASSYYYIHLSNRIRDSFPRISKWKIKDLIPICWTWGAEGPG